MTPWSGWAGAGPRRAGFAVLLCAAMVAGCEPGPRDLSMRLWTEDMEITVLSDPQPPRARELGGNRFRVVVRGFYDVSGLPAPNVALMQEG